MGGLGIGGMGNTGGLAPGSRKENASLLFTEEQFNEVFSSILEQVEGSRVISMLSENFIETAKIMLSDYRIFKRQNPGYSNVTLDKTANYIGNMLNEAKQCIKKLAVPFTEKIMNREIIKIFNALKMINRSKSISLRSMASNNPYAFFIQSESKNISLSTDITHYIFSFLPYNDILRARFVCRKWRQLTENQCCYQGQKYILLYRHIDIGQGRLVVRISDSVKDITYAMIKEEIIRIIMANMEKESHLTKQNDIEKTAPRILGCFGF